MVRRSAQATMRTRWARGFALVDAIVGAIIVGVSLAVIIGLTGRALSSQKQGEEIAIASALADETLQMVLARGPDDYSKRFPVEGACDAPFASYRYRVAISGGGSDGSAGTGTPFRVSATISWGSAPAPQSLVVETLMASRLGGLDDVGGQPDPDRRPEAGVTRTQ